jgi:hypothetical protein
MLYLGRNCGSELSAVEFDSGALAFLEVTLSEEMREEGAARLTTQARPLLQPATPSCSGAAVGETVRAHALEYIAAQLGQINAKLEKIVKTFPQTGQND